MKFLMAVTFAALTVAVISPVQAKRYNHYTKTAPGPGDGPRRQQIDVAALPAYPTEQTNVGARQPSPMGRKHIAPPSSPTVAFGGGIIRSAKTGATAHVSPKYVGRFQAYIDDLEAQGATIRFMGGIRPGKCWTGGRHPCGMALDTCQLRRGIVDKRCNLPGPASIFAIAARHGLFEGAGWRSSDYGHAQAGGNDAADVRFGSTTIASARTHIHRKVRLAHQ